MHPYMLCGSGLFDQLDVDRDLHVVADGYATGLEQLVPGQAEIAALDLRRRAEAGALATPGILAASLGRDVEHDLTRDAADRQVAGDREVVTLHAVDAAALEGHRGEVLRVEE